MRKLKSAFISVIHWLIGNTGYTVFVVFVSGLAFLLRSYINEWFIVLGITMNPLVFITMTTIIVLSVAWAAYSFTKRLWDKLRPIAKMFWLRIVAIFSLSPFFHRKSVLSISIINETDRGKVGIVIHNLSSKPLSNVRVRLKEGSCFFQRQFEGKFPRLMHCIGSRSDFNMEHTFATDDRVIIGQREETVYIAKITGDRNFNWLLDGGVLSENDDPHMYAMASILNAPYEFELLIDASLDDRHQMKTHFFSMQLAFRLEFYHTADHGIDENRSPKLTLVGKGNEHE